MATPPKVGARNDVTALKDARRETTVSITEARRAMDEVARMRETVGRPDYGRLERRLGTLALSLARASQALEEMWTIRVQAGLVEEEGLAARIGRIEAELAWLRETMEQQGG